MDGLGNIYLLLAARTFFLFFLSSLYFSLFCLLTPLSFSLSAVSQGYHIPTSKKDYVEAVHVKYKKYPFFFARERLHLQSCCVPSLYPLLSPYEEKGIYSLYPEVLFTCILYETLLPFHGNPRLCLYFYKGDWWLAPDNERTTSKVKYIEFT